MAEAALKRMVVVVGATGVGKSKLGIDLARALNGEVVNADVIQMYKGLDIASARVTEEEMQGVPHHMLAFLDSTEKSFTVRSFRDKALPIINDIAERGKLPIVVGGTLYYIQALLWPSLMDESPTLKAQGDSKLTESVTRCPETNRTLSSCELFAKLREADPKTAERLHSRDRRKIVRQLEIIEETGRLPSELIALQESAGVASQLRFKANVLWLTCSKTEHAERLSRRVDAMMEAGLWDEARSFIREQGIVTPRTPTGGEGEEAAAAAAAEAEEPEPGSAERRTSGIFQAIGYSEFLPYYEVDQLGLPLPPKLDKQGVLTSCTDTLKLRHRQYSKRQTKWITSRLLTRNVPVHALDTTRAADGEAEWQEGVLQPAVRLCEWFSQQDSLDNDPADLPRANKKPDPGRANNRKRFHCQLCQASIIGETQWQAHLGSRAHKHKVRQTHFKMRQGQERRARERMEKDEWKQLLEETAAEGEAKANAAGGEGSASGEADAKRPRLQG